MHLSLIPMRKQFLVFVVAIVLSGLVPVVAMGAACHDLPCCDDTQPAVQRTSSDCCSPSTCIKQVELLKAGDSSFQASLKATAALPVLAPPGAMAAMRQRLATPSISPPSTAERLSTLSVLLI